MVLHARQITKECAVLVNIDGPIGQYVMCLLEDKQEIPLMMLLQKMEGKSALVRRSEIAQYHANIIGPSGSVIKVQVKREDIQSLVLLL